MVVLGFNQFLGQGFFGAFGRIQTRSAKGGGISRHCKTCCGGFVAFRSFADKDAAGGVVTVVARVDADALETVLIV